MILSGGPASVYGDGAPDVPQELLELGVPVLGICYGLHWMCQALGGEVKSVDKREFGHTSIQVVRSSELFEGVEGRSVVWMSHGDSVTRLPQGFGTYAESDTCPQAAVGDPERGFFGVQFHPEVSHTERGTELLRNFVRGVCGSPGDWRADSIAEREVAAVQALVGRLCLGGPRLACRCARYRRAPAP